MALAAVLALWTGSPAGAGSGSSEAREFHYPPTRQSDVVENIFGDAVADPYRWLEADMRVDAEVAAWAQGQDAVSRGYLKSLPMRDWFERRIRELFDYERFGLPEKAGRRYFYTRSSGLMNQPQLFMRKGLGGKPRLLLDPNLWPGGGTRALDAWVPSAGGRYLLYSVQDDGSDWRSLHVRDVDRGEDLPDDVRWVKFSSLAWIGEKGFLYSRFPAPGSDEARLDPTYDQAVYFHRIGTSQSEDELVFATPDHPGYGHTATVTQDGRLAVITSTLGTDARREVHVIDLKSRKRGTWPAIRLADGAGHDWKLVAGVGTRLWFVTNWQASRYRLVTGDLANPGEGWREVIGQRPDVLDKAEFVGDQLVLSYLRDNVVRAEIVDLGGNGARQLALGDIGTASGFRGRLGDPETFFRFASFNLPPSIYRMDIASGEARPFAEPQLAFDPRAYVVEQRFYASKDGTKVPLYVVRSRAVADRGRPVPTLLYGYGGFDVALRPEFSSVRAAWLEAGGAFALANVRGGGEYGEAWHDAGRRANKQNTFDDFIAAAEYLLAEGITASGGLAIQGSSNGGLLVAAVVNQRPDLFAAANVNVGVTDMLRFDRFTAGRYWIGDYGDPSSEADFRVLRAYSPYHNIRPGKDYPAILVTTAEADDRVVPAHSFKYAAALQAADIGERPHLLRIEARAGHGTGKPVDKTIDEGADVLAFLAHWTGLDWSATASFTKMANNINGD
ncbi:S9 family peptidase [Novosphingobium sp. PC22D]|uniref:prolyl oligopeptidase family serine peptidase n=1 Tax=Novosphingobium sp. PC22D TaxID=1962403 RepID=UPI000BF1F7BA|nr:prolyl oligopeptidase family serine peptidase [Novosphingobium sp. PC22D]PEQ11991.1 S9 family peptidase [Novosphingobium sp. PC22D]